MRHPFAIILPILLVIGCRRGGEFAEVTAGPLRITEAFAFQPITRDEAAVYFEIKNTGDQPDTLLGASTSIAATAMIHGMNADGMAAMSGLEIPPHGMIQLQPGRLHLMLTSLTRMPRSGEKVPVTLRFLRAGEVTMEVPVRPYGQ